MVEVAISVSGEDTSFYQGDAQEFDVVYGPLKGLFLIPQTEVDISNGGISKIQLLIGNKFISFKKRLVSEI